MVAYARRGKLGGQKVPDNIEVCWDAVFPAEAKSWLENNYGFKVQVVDGEIVVPLLCESDCQDLVSRWNERN
ncbi:MAG: hypothetical protein A3G45_02220 [Candidatus Staskawiczbacteria bacterium RIFCSPLOWO2_12_FULL_37_15]|uniref:Uncharacterized protein n=2 Tax=Parcubacteria group TaxID=1794811 RepID=A0A1G2E3C8_9BACT|nr:MAG: hypothetical protein US35_C0004G0006 [Parcubacteria group bacterium GW2011_GWA2_37_10]OGZ20255.1 MAG: hypothetical protein A2626_02445 [Candidatus Nealsonbacteria bacterium RIFCSPHIGHO2_01_FULL_38_55]OGZ77119.1 MAG: hypothetical protein A3G45_02220 [Candidatus Staskawiczbacteria bacterium RIFCSPLOWO2_12_FULL_37_15]